MSDSRTSNSTVNAWAASAVAVVIAGLVTWAISDGGDSAGGVKVAVICAVWAFVLNWIVCIPSFRAQTEKFFDLTGSITYLSVIVLAVVLSDNLDFRSILIAVLVAIWAIRLGSFLFARISRDGKDGRFDSARGLFRGCGCR